MIKAVSPFKKSKLVACVIKLFTKLKASRFVCVFCGHLRILRIYIFSLTKQCDGNATLVIFASDCLTTFSGESFLWRKCKKNLLPNFCSQDRSFQYISQLLLNFTYSTRIKLFLSSLKRTLAVCKNGKMKTGQRYERVEPDRG